MPSQPRRYASRRGVTGRERALAGADREHAQGGHERGALRRHPVQQGRIQVHAVLQAIRPGPDRVLAARGGLAVHGDFAARRVDGARHPL